MLRQVVVSRYWAKMPENRLSDREALVLASFRYGLASNPEEVARHLQADPFEIVQICRRLARAGLINAAASVMMSSGCLT